MEDTEHQSGGGLRAKLVKRLSGICVIVFAAWVLLPITGGNLGQATLAFAAITYFVLYSTIAAAVGVITAEPRLRGAGMVGFLTSVIWLAPSMVLIRSGWVVFGLAIGMTAMARTLTDLRGEASGPALFSSVTIAAILQAGAAANLSGERQLALLLMAIGFCWLAWNLSGREQTASQPPRLWLRIALPASATVLFALLLGGAHAPSSVSTGRGDDALNMKGPNLHDGIILKPEHVQNVTVLAPPPVSREQRAANAAAARPFHIPFSGEYWFFHAFFHRVGTRLVAFHERPPETSMVEAGDPTEWNFSGPAMTMKAHQKLDTPINLACCQSIDISLKDSDTPPGTYMAELLVSNTESTDPAAQSQSLGVVSPVQATPGEEMAKFAVPAGLALARFNTLDVVFHMGAQRRNRSVNVAIREFQLIPSGR